MARLRASSIELLMDTGRRPDEVCQLPLDCVTLDADSSPVLVYDNHNGARNGRRLPISRATAEVITVQQGRGTAAARALIARSWQLGLIILLLIGHGAGANDGQRRPGWPDSS